MTITIPTIDDFKEETVMTVIRKVVDYLIEQLVPEINDNDVTNASLSLSNDTVTMRLTMGDGTSKSSSVSLSKYATDADLNALEDEFNALAPQLSIKGNTLTIQINGKSSSVVLPSSGGDVNGLTMNATGKVDVTSYDTGVNYQIKSSGNNMTLVGNIVVGTTNNAIYNDSATIVNSVNVSTTDAGKINVNVNGKSSGNVQVSGTVDGANFAVGIENNALYVRLVYWDAFLNAWATVGPSIKLQDLANALKPYLN